jgi:glycosyltransferase involved in cell wall biosynthesis
MSRLSQTLRRISSRAIALAQGYRKSLRRAERPSLAILDDVFPNRLSAFRLSEYNAYLEQFPGARVYTTHEYPGLEGERGFEPLLDEYREHYPHLASRVRPLTAELDIQPQAFYVMFLNNAVRFLPRMERARRPFLMTLYPGGGFALNNAESDDKLRRVAASPWLAGMISTQRVTREYLLTKGFLEEGRITSIFGGVASFGENHGLAACRRVSPRDKGGFDICFVANKYSPQGQDKGYPVFVEFAQRLALRRSDVTFHVVGKYSPADLDVASLGSRILFHGAQRAEFFPGFHAHMDLMVSPNVPNVLGAGMFDGFPTGCSVAAALDGVALFCTDELQLNPGFRDGEEIVLVRPEAEDLVEKVQCYLDDPARLAALAERGQTAMQRAFSHSAQLSPRLALIGSLLEGAASAAGGIPC